MAKKIPCFICGTLTEVKDERAIAILCAQHKTTENIEKMKNKIGRASCRERV